MNSPGYLAWPSGLLGCFLALSILTSPGPVYSGDAVSVCYSHWPPYSETTGSGAKGISISIMKQAARLLDLEIGFVEDSWNGCLGKVKRGELDVILDAAMRAEYLQGPTSFSIYSDTFWVNNNSNISRYEQLSGGKIALVEGYSYDQRLLVHIENLSLEVVTGSDDSTNLRSLARGEVDAVITDLASGFVLVEQESLTAHPILPPFTYEKLYASFHRGIPDLQRRFDGAISELIKQGYVDEIYQRFLGVTYSSLSPEYN